MRFWGVEIFLLLCCAMVAQADIYRVTFRTEPDQVKIYLAEKYVGLSGEAISLELGNTEGTSYQFRFTKEGYGELPVWVNVNQLKRSQIYPVDGEPPLVLKPKSVWIRLRHQPEMLGGIAVVTLGLTWLLGVNITKARAELKRSQTLARFGQSSGDGGSLLMNVVGGYRLIGVLGQGGMSTVYRGIPEDSLDEKDDVAVKILSRELMENTDGVERFRREINLSKNLVHPNIVRLLEFGTHDERLYLVQEIVRGNTLREVVAADGLPPEETWKYISPIFSAVHFAHTQTIVHRDLKPENIMLSNGIVKVADFGLAKSADSKKLTNTGTTLGTPSYMAPEQIQGQDLDPRIDQYALGIMTYELLTGQPPFDADDAIKVIFMHMMEDAKPLAEVKPELGQAISDVVAKMLEKEPNNRYSSVQDALKAIEGAFALSVEHASS